MDNVIKRANIQYNDYSFSLKVLSENSSFLTESGIQLLEMMLDDLKIYK